MNEKIIDFLIYGNNKEFLILSKILRFLLPFSLIGGLILIFIHYLAYNYLLEIFYALISLITIILLFRFQHLEQMNNI